MTQIKYNFEKRDKDLIPMVEFTLVNPKSGKKVSSRAMLDSGAFMTVLHSQLAAMIGIDLSSIKEQVPFQGVGNEANSQLMGKMCFVDVELFGTGKTKKINMPVLFSNNMNPNGFALLGRQGFFDQFDEVVFNYVRNKFYLRYSS